MGCVVWARIQVRGGGVCAGVIVCMSVYVCACNLLHLIVARVVHVLHHVHNTAHRILLGAALGRLGALLLAGLLALQRLPCVEAVFALDLGELHHHLSIRSAWARGGVGLELGVVCSVGSCLQYDVEMSVIHTRHDDALTMLHM